MSDDAARTLQELAKAIRRATGAVGGEDLKAVWRAASGPRDDLRLATLAWLAARAVDDAKGAGWAVRLLLSLIESHHGPDATRGIVEAALPPKTVDKRVRDARLRFVVADLRRQWSDATNEKIAEALMSGPAEPIRKWLGLHHTAPESLNKRFRRKRSVGPDKTAKNVRRHPK